MDNEARFAWSLVAFLALLGLSALGTGVAWATTNSDALGRVATVLGGAFGVSVFLGVLIAIVLD